MSWAPAANILAAEPMPTPSERVRAAVRKLRSLHDGDVGVVETIASGPAAVPSLKEILFAREPSGLYETRRRAVEALAGLRAYNVLRDFLQKPHKIADPIEQTGEDAVVNAAARAVGDLCDSNDLPLLLTLLHHRSLAGVIEAVARFQRREALPYFIEALADDFLRPAAEDGIRALGATARRALFQSVLRRESIGDRESSSSRSRRRSALGLLLEIGIPAKFVWSPLHDLVQDPDPWIAMLSARICLASGMEREKLDAICRLIDLLKTPDAILVGEIEDALVRNFGIAEAAIDSTIEWKPAVDDPEAPWWLRDKALTALLRVKERSTRKSRGDSGDA